MRNSVLRLFLAVLMTVGWFTWLGGGILTAQVPPPITRSVLTTNIPPFGSVGQALFRTTALPYLNWSNITVAPAPDSVLSNAYWNAWGSLSSNSITAKLDSNIWWNAWSTGSNDLYTISSNIAVNFTLGASNSLYTISSNVSQSLVNNSSNSLYTISSNIAVNFTLGASNSLYTTSSNIAEALATSAANTASNALYTTSSNIAQALATSAANTASNALYTTSSNIAQSLVNNSSNSLYTISSNIAVNFTLGASNSLYTTSSNIAESLVNNASNSLYTVSSNIAVNFTLGASNSLYTVSSNISQALVNSSSNALYTTSSNIAQAKADTAMTTATNYTRAYAQPLTIATNLITGADQTIAMDVDSTVSITNAVAGAVNVWFTNAVDRKWCVLRCVADGTPRTLSFTNASGLTINLIATNGFSVTTLPQCPVTANKIATFVARTWVSAGTTNIDLFGNVQP